MKKLYAIVLFFFALGAGYGQVTTTPNLNLQLPPYAYPNWNIIVNNNFSKIDTAYGGLLNPYQGTYAPATAYSSGNIVLYNNNTYISLVNSNLNNTPSSSPTDWALLSYSSGGGGGTGTVGSGPAGAVPAYGIPGNGTGTVVGANPNLYELNSGMTKAQVNALFASLGAGSATVIIPDGTAPFPISNPNNVTFDDVRAGARTTELSQYGLVCDERQVGVITTSGSKVLQPVYAIFSSSDIGKKMGIVSYTSPTVYETTATAMDSATATSVSITGGVATITANNDFVPGEGVIPQYFSTFTYLNGVLQGVISANSTSFTIPTTHGNVANTADTTTILTTALVSDTAAPFSQNSGSIPFGTDNAPALQLAMTKLGASGLVGQFPAGCSALTGPVVWNNGQSFVGQAANSLALYGLAGRDVFVTPDGAGLGSVSRAGQLFQDIGIVVDNRVDATYPWSLVTSSGTTAMPALYRPLAEGTLANDPRAPQWALPLSTYQNAYLGVASTTQNSNVICVPNAEAPPSTAASNSLVFRDTPTAYSGTAVNLTGSGCAAGNTGVTISPAMPNVAGYTLAQAEWVSSGGIQNLATAVPAGTVTYPLTVTLTNPLGPSSYYEGGFETRGRVKIGSEQYNYLGATQYAPYTIVLRSGPATSVGWAAATAVTPMNPCSADFNTPYPVTPTLNAGDSTPSGANYFPALCGGNAGIAMPQVNGNAFVGTGWVFSDVRRIFIQGLISSPGNANNTASFYAGGNNSPYNTTIDSFRSVGNTYGFVEGPASYGQHGVAAVGPTGAGNHITNCSINAAWGIILDDFENGGIDTCNNNSTAYNQYDGSTIGSVTAFVLDGTLDEQTGGGVTNVGNFTMKDVTAEPENGTHAEAPTYAVLNCYTCYYLNDSLEGAGAIIGGSEQIFEGGALSGLNLLPVIMYGSNIEIKNTQNTVFGPVCNTFYCGAQFLNWGINNRAKPYSATGNYGLGAGGIGSPTPSVVGARMSYDGNDNSAIKDGLGLTPYTHPMASYFDPGEFTTQANVDRFPMNYASRPDPLSPSGFSAGCLLYSSGYGCNPTNIDGFGGGVYIGGQNRITNIKYWYSTAVATPAGTNQANIKVLVSSNGGTCGYPIGHSFGSQNVTTSPAFQSVGFEVDFTDPLAQGCELQLAYYGTGSTSPNPSLLKVAYANFTPMPKQLLLLTASPTVGSGCSNQGAVIGDDNTAIYWCGVDGTVKATGTGGGTGGFTNPMTTLGDLIVGGTNGSPGRLAGSTAATVAILAQTGTGAVSATPAWLGTTGTGNVVLSASPVITTPSFTAPTYAGGMTGDTATFTGQVQAASVNVPGPNTGIAGLGGQFYALGATAQVGTSPTAATCVTNHVCDSESGTFTFTTGTGTLTAGVDLTITVPGVRTNYPNCVVAGSGGTTVPGWYATTVTNPATVTISTTLALTASTPYTVTIWCGGV